ncbi:MAG: shikimate kinase [Lachnospiraceae bacterium]
MNHILLIGFMGSGKSTMAYRLSYRIKCSFIDTDKFIEKKAGCSIKSMFATRGEDYFREQETACLEALLSEKTSKILALGGGTPMRAENRILMRKLGTSIYLKASPETIYQRLKHDKVRPLLQGPNPKQAIEELLAIRDAIYEEAADYVISIDDKEMYEVLQEITEVALEIDKKEVSKKHKKEGR